jgi:hypothetical protein
MKNKTVKIKDIIAFFILLFTSNRFCKELLYTNATWVIYCTRASVSLAIGLNIHFCYSFIHGNAELSNDYLLNLVLLWFVALLLGFRGFYALYWRAYKDQSTTED